MKAKVDLYERSLGVLSGILAFIGAYFAGYTAGLTTEMVDLPELWILTIGRGGYSICFLVAFDILGGCCLARPFSGKLLLCPEYEPPMCYRTLYRAVASIRDGFYLLGLTVFLSMLAWMLLFDPAENRAIHLEYFHIAGIALFVGGCAGSSVRGLLKEKKLLLLPVCLLMAGCAHKGLGGSFVGDLPTGAAVQSIAADAAGQVSALYPPGHTSLFLLTPKKDAGNGFSVALEDALRRQGFTVATAADSTTVAVAYVLDHLASDEKGEEPAWYLQLRISDNDEGGTAFARSYTASGSPEGGRSRTSIAFTRSTAVRLADKAAVKAEKTYDSTVEYLTE